VLIVHQVSDLLKLVFVVSEVDSGLCVVAQVLRATEDMRAEWVDGDESVVVSLLVSLLNVANVLHGLVEVLHLSTILLNWCSGIRHAEHLQGLGLVCLSVGHFVLLAENKLLIQEFLQGLLLSTLFENVLLLGTKLLGEDRMVSDVVCLWLINLIAWHLLLRVLNDIVHLKLEPLLESFVENNTVSIIERADIICAVSIIHDTLINFELGEKTAILSVVIELDGFHEREPLLTATQLTGTELGLVVSVVLVGLDNWHVTLLGLDDIHGQVFQIILVIFCLKETLDLDEFLVVTIWVLGLVVLSREIEVSPLGVNDCLRRFDILFQVWYLDTLACIIRCLNVLHQLF
jgi:hypothetical protein